MRITYLDTTKGILVLGMVLAHVIQFFAADNAIMALFSRWTNLVSFSGFFFLFRLCFLFGIPEKRKHRNKENDKEFVQDFDSLLHLSNFFQTVYQ
jgi:hypothetical protein